VSKGISKKEIRDFYKNKAGITIVEELKKSKSCAKCCFFSTVSKYCGEHQIKTSPHETCSKFKKQRVHKVYYGGSASPK
jgi:hypothetical protein